MLSLKKALTQATLEYTEARNNYNKGLILDTELVKKARVFFGIEKLIKELK